MKAKFVAHFLVRDKNGKPRIEGDPRKLPAQIKQALTDEEYNLAVHEYDMEGINANS
jgi:hypothetical protein